MADSVRRALRYKFVTVAVPAPLKVVRPYATEAEFIAGDAWAVTVKGMLLVDQPPQPNDTSVRFVVMVGKDALIRGEGRVEGSISAEDGRPGGLRVRFKRLDAKSKALVDRCVAFQRLNAGAGRAPGDPAIEARVSFASISDIESAPAAAASSPGTHDAPRPLEPLDLDASAFEPSEPRASARPVAPQPPPPAASEPEAAAAAAASVDRIEESGLRHRPRPIEAPGDREALLERLRVRARPPVAPTPASKADGNVG